MATVGETLFIALGLDASSAVEGLKQFQNNLILNMFISS